jgi:uncharacterized repeat protein (TIGR01451 family)
VSGRPVFESDECIFLFTERQDVTTAETLNPARPKTTNILADPSPDPQPIPAGTVVDSYLLHADRPGQPTSGVTTLTGRWTFDEPIIGISIAHSGLTFGDPRFGLSTITYEQNETSRGVETTAQAGANADDVHVDPNDPRTLVVTFKFLGAMDEIRVFTAEPGMIVVRKDAVPDHGQNFAFTAGGNLAPAQFSLDDDADDATLADEQRFEEIAALSGYSVAETVPAGWSQTSATCSDGSAVTNIGVTPGETVTCTFTNTQTTQPCQPAPGNAVVVASPPRDLRLGRTESDSCIFLFAEQQDLTLASNVTVDASPVVSGSPPVLPAGSVVSSYLLHSDKVGGTQASVTLQGSYTFPEPVLGLVYSISRLESTDAGLGAPATCPPSPPAAGLCYETNDVNGRGLELPTDVADVQPDGHTVVFTMGTNTGLDNVRVLVGTLPHGTIVVRKDAEPDAPDDFSFTAGGGLSPTAFALDDDPADATLSNEQRFGDVPAGSGYSLAETLPEGWSQTSVTCSDGSPVTNIAVSAGETVTCTFANARHVEPCTPTPGNAIVPSGPPRDLRVHRTESDACILLFTEQQDVTLAQDINPRAPSTTNVLAGPNRRIPAGTVVDGYLLHADKVGSSDDVVNLSGRWTFDEPILGISVVRDGLLVGDGITGLATLTYEPSDPDRGLESAAPQGDFLRVDPADPRTLEVDFRFAGSMDEVRVFTGVIQPPDPCDATDPSNAIEQAYPVADLRINGKESDRCIYLFDEQQDIPLPQRINVKKPLPTNMLAGPNVTIPAGNEVDSFLLHADSPGAVGATTVTLSGSWRFEEPILGVSVTKAGLVTGDGLTGLPDPGSLRYEKTLGARGLEGPAGDTDSISVDANDVHLLHVRFSFNAMDEIRVFTGTPPPDCIPPVPGNAVMPAEPDPEADLRLDRYESNSCIYLFDEQQDVALGEAINVKKAEATNMLAGPNVRIPAGHEVDSFLLHADTIGPPGATTVSLSGEVLFEEDVIGVSVTLGGLNAGDGLTGLPDPEVVRYEKVSPARGLEGPAGDGHDVVTVDPNNPKRLIVQLTLNVMDELRVFTGPAIEDCEPPTGNAIVPAEPSPVADLRLDHYESNACLYLFDEQQDVALAEDVSPKRPAATNMLAASNRTVRVPAGSVVDSFLLHGDSLGPATGSPPVKLAGAVTFEEPIVGVSVTSAGLRAGDGLTGLPDPDVIRYERASEARGVEGPGLDDDVVYVDADDPRTLHVTFHFNAMDEVRVYTGELATGTIVVRKDALPDDAQDFSFTAGGGFEPAAFSLDDDGDETNGLASSASHTVYAGAGYSAAESAVPAGWDSTDASCDDGSPQTNIDVGAGETVTCTFTNTKRAFLSGVKFDDEDANGSQAASGEPGLSGWTIRAYVDGNADGDLDADETTVAASIQTSANGSYALELVPGSYVLCEVAQGDWEQTTPAGNACGDAIAGLADGGHALALSPGEAIARSFGNRLRRASVSGVKFADEDANGTQAPAGEPALGGWEIRAYADDGDGTLEAGETAFTAATTAPDGSYTLTLRPGSYVVCEVSQTDWEQTAPTGNACAGGATLGSGGHAATFAPGDTASGRDFGNRLRRAQVAGLKFLDEDANWMQAASGEPGLGGWEIRAYVDDNADGDLDADETTMAGSAQTAADGAYTLTLAPGRYILCEVAQVDWEQTAPTGNACGDAVAELADGGHALTLTPGQQVAGSSFGNRLKRVRIDGVKFADEDASGVQAASGEPSLSGWTIRAYVDADVDGALDAGEAVAATATTSADGSYDFTLAPGSYLLCEIAQQPWEQTTPSGTACTADASLATGGHALTLAPGTSATRHFGNRLPRATVTGTKFEDIDPNGARAATGEPGLSGWEIRAYVDENADGDLDAGETSLAASGVTVADGTYSLTLGAPRSYVVCEVAQAAWRQTAPAGNQCGNAMPALAGGGHAVTLIPGQLANARDFGNYGGQLTISKAQQDCTPSCAAPPTTGSLALDFGDRLVYTVTVRNIGPGTASASTVRDTLPAFVNVTAVTPPPAVGCSAQTSSCAVPRLASAAQVDIVVDTRVTTTYGGCTMVLTSVRDVRNGTAGRDIICGLGGADEIHGLGGNDTVYGDTPPGFVAPTLVNRAWIDDDGDAVRDVSEPQAATTATTLLGSPAGDELHGEAGADELFGQEGVDTIFGSSGNDSINGGADGDTVWGGPDDDNIHGESANTADPGPDTLNGEGGDDVIFGHERRDVINGGLGNDERLNGGDGNDVINGGDGNDLIEGVYDDDELSGGEGADRMWGDSMSGPSGGERAGNDTMNGNGGNDVMRGQDGGDTIVGASGNDDLYGWTGPDELHGGTGTNFLDCGTGTDRYSLGPDRERYKDCEQII